MEEPNTTINARLHEIENAEEIKILYACESGSRAWGFASPDSDFDIRFIYKRQLKDYLVLKDLPDTLEYPIQNNLDFNGWDLKKFLFHIHKSNGVMFEWLQSPVTYIDINGFRNKFQKLISMEDQINNDSNDISYFEIGKFLSLLCKSNPTVLEMLFSPGDCIRKRSSLFSSIEPKRFLSKKCEDSFARYAFTQIKKARGLNKKISNPLEKERKTILDFCYILHEQGSIQAKRFLTLHGFDENRCGLVAVPHMESVFALFYDESTNRILKFNGLLHDKNSMDLPLSSVPKELLPIGHIYFNKNGFSKYCKEYKDYWDWVNKRNEARYESTIKHGKNYDSKNMMHTFRLLEIAEEIAQYKTIFVRRKDKDELFKIRSGVYSYSELIEKANKKLSRIEMLYQKSDLPAEPDCEYAEKLLISIRDNFYLNNMESNHAHIIQKRSS